jgi:hypothetical protein
VRPRLPTSFGSSGTKRLAKSSLTVAGQWRILTALPEHSTSIHFIRDATVLRLHLKQCSLMVRGHFLMRNDYDSDVDQPFAPPLRQILAYRAKPPVDRRTAEIVTDLPSRSIRVRLNPVGLLACGSSERNCLPSA